MEAARLELRRRGDEEPPEGQGEADLHRGEGAVADAAPQDLGGGGGGEPHGALAEVRPDFMSPKITLGWARRREKTVGRISE